MEKDFADTAVRRHETQEKGHGRNETRWYYVCPRPRNLPDASRWTGLKAIGMTINTTLRDGRETSEVRYYILSKYVAARRFAAMVRGPWSIENRLPDNCSSSLLCAA